jgi:hypothetical protein
LAYLAQLSFSLSLLSSPSLPLPMPTPPTRRATMPPPSRHRLDTSGPMPAAWLLCAPTQCCRPVFSFPSWAGTIGGSRSHRRLYVEEWQPRRRFPAPVPAASTSGSVEPQQVELLPLLPVNLLVCCLIGFMSRVRKLGKL